MFEDNIRVFYNKNDPVAKLEILKGPFSGIVFSYGAVSFPESADGEDEHILKFEYDIVSGSPSDLTSFENEIGQMLINIIRATIDAGDSLIYSGGVDEN